MPISLLHLEKAHKCRFSEDSLRCAILSGLKAALRAVWIIFQSSILDQGVGKAGPSSPNLEVNGPSLRAELILPLGTCQGARDSTDYKPLTFYIWSQDVS